MLEKLYGVVEKNWDKFTEAPLIFLLPLVAGAVMGWIVKKTIAQGHIDALLARIETLNERLTSRELSIMRD
jgi:ABC-type proline/glycine betaine transport system substrate-binding protein